MSIADRVDTIRELNDDEGQRAATALEDMEESIEDAMRVCREALFDAGLTEQAAHRIAKRVATRVGREAT